MCDNNFLDFFLILCRYYLRIFPISTLLNIEWFKSTYCLNNMKFGYIMIRIVRDIILIWKIFLCDKSSNKCSNILLPNDISNCNKIMTGRSLAFPRKKLHKVLFITDFFLYDGECYYSGQCRFNDYPPNYNA